MKMSILLRLDGAAQVFYELAARFQRKKRPGEVAIAQSRQRCRVAQNVSPAA
jgi:hypothetical protein